MTAASFARTPAAKELGQLPSPIAGENMQCLISGLLGHGPARRSMDISATTWHQSFTHGLLARPEAAFYECSISNVFPLCIFFAIFACK